MRYNSQKPGRWYHIAEVLGETEKSYHVRFPNGSKNGAYVPKKCSYLSRSKEWIHISSWLVNRVCKNFHKKRRASAV